MAGNPIAGFGIPQVITDAATQTFDMSSGGFYSWTMGANRTMSAPTNMAAGQLIFLEIKQDATGSRIMTWPSTFSWAAGTAPTLTTTAAAIDCILGFWNPTLGKWRMNIFGLAMA